MLQRLRYLFTFKAVKTAAVMTLAITLPLLMVVRAIVRAHLHVAGLTGPHGVAGTCAFDTHTMTGTVDMGIPARNGAHMYIHDLSLSQSCPRRNATVMI